MGLFELGDTVGQRDQTCVLQHAQTTSSTDAVASCGVVAPPMATYWIGTWQPTNSVKAVANMAEVWQNSVCWHSSASSPPPNHSRRVFIKARGISSSCNPRVSHGSVEPDRLDCAVVIKKGRS
jgi:hypothetical protein